MANFQVAAVISNHCVLQRNKNISIFGEGNDGDSVKVSLFNKKNELLCSNEAEISGEKWIVKLLPQKAQEGCSLKIVSNSTEIIYSDISIGEVWIAGGQSNMEFELQNCTEGPEELKLKENPKIRFYYTNKIGWKDEHFYEAEKNTCWQTWESTGKTAWSAVGYFFAKRLSEELNVTVGVIGCNWGGTSASAWMNLDSLAVDAELKTYIDEQIEGTKGKTIQQQCDEYDQYTKENDIWQQKCNELYQKNPNIEWSEVQQILGPSLWPGPKSCKNPYRPAGLYECMLQRITPYTSKGVIWYQGESDDHKPQMYHKLFSRMIQVWRDDWKDDSMPFVFVQLPNNRYKQDKDFKHWCLIREAQAKTAATVKNAFMTCALDLGQYNDIHPRAKSVIGKRLANTALYNVYSVINPELSESPVYESSISIGGRMEITFKNAETGFTVKEDEYEMEKYKEMEAAQGTPVPADFTGFEVAGEDKVYYPAEFAFCGTDGHLNTITLHSDKVSKPKYARYAWFNYGPVTIFGKNGLPLSPFRTSTKDSEVKTEHAEIQQIMTV